MKNFTSIKKYLCCFQAITNCHRSLFSDNLFCRKTTEQVQTRPRFNRAVQQNGYVVHGRVTELLLRGKQSSSSFNVPNQSIPVLQTKIFT